MNLNNKMLNIDKKTIKKNKKRKKRKKQIKNRFFHKKPFFIEIKNQKIKNGFLYNTMYHTQVECTTLYKISSVLFLNTAKNCNSFVQILHQ